ncbi:MAG: hypothetical protein WCA84_10580 [Ignavibacteriaceae bacterium]|jgi:hypothetical protein
MKISNLHKLLIQPEGFLIIALFFICFQISLFPQSIPDLENSFYKLQAGLNSEQVKLDSLKNILNLRARKITKAKSKTDYNKDVVTGLMAGSIPVSNEIAELQRKIVNLQANLENIKIRLSEMYSSKIDSLQRLLKMDNLSNEKTSEIKEKIYLYTGKKILVMPKIDLLTFYPDKIIGINLKNIDDLAQKNVYEEYLQKALSEVDDRLSNVNQSIFEVDKIISLQKKTARFLEETEFGTGLPQQSVTEQTTPKLNRSAITGTNLPVNSALTSQLDDYSLLLSQLHQSIYPQMNWTVQPDSGRHNITYQQYQTLLEKLKKSLLEYKFILTHKIENSK